MAVSAAKRYVFHDVVAAKSVAEEFGLLVRDGIVNFRPTGSYLYDFKVNQALEAAGGIPEEEIPDLTPGSPYMQHVFGNP